MILNIKIVRPHVAMPKYESFDASGFDLAAAETVVFKPGETKVIPTGIAVELWRTGPVLYEIQIRPRGGTSLRTPLRIANSPGTIDVDYRGELGIVMQNTNGLAYTVEKGERVAQAVVCPVIQPELVQVKELSDTARGAGAYGSTGAK